MEFNMETTKALVAEFLVTYLFLFGAHWGGLHAGTIQALNVFLTATAYIYTFGGISGAHFNPAVTVGALVGQKIDVVQGSLYIVLQLIAGIAAAGTVMGLDKTLGAKMAPSVGKDIFSALGLEIISTFILVFVIYATAMGVNAKSIDEDGKAVEAKKNFAPIAIGAALGFLCFYGAYFNPAAALGPAVVTMQFSSIWIPFVGDFIGAALAASLHTYFFAM
jgi:aquaporin Z